MIITKTYLQYYRERKCDSLANFTIEPTITIHKLLNSKVSYDPFSMRKKGTSRHNAYNLFRSLYKGYTSGRLSRLEFLNKLYNNKYLEKYTNHF